MFKLALRATSRSHLLRAPTAAFLTRTPAMWVGARPSTTILSTTSSFSTSSRPGSELRVAPAAKVNLTMLPEQKKLMDENTQEHSDAYYFSIIAGIFGASIASILWAYHIPSGENVFEAPEKVVRHVLNSMVKNTPDEGLLTVSEALSRVPDAALNSILEVLTHKTAFTPFLIINVGVFIMSQFKTQFEDVIYKHFVLSHVNIRRGRLHTLLTSAFTHANLIHLAVNMLTLASFAVVYTRIWSPEKFTAVYLSSAVAANSFGLAASYGLYQLSTRLGNPRPYFLMRSFGASGVATALIAYVCLRFPHAKLGVLFLPPTIDAQTLFPFAVLFDLLGVAWVMSGRTSPIAHTVHLGGYLFGALVFAYDKYGNTTKRKLYW